MLNIQKYVRPQSIDEAYELNQVKSNRIIGGMLWLKTGNWTINTAIDLCDLGLNRIDETDEEFSIGTYVTLRQLELNESFNTYTSGAAGNAVKDIVGVQFRNMATVGGSIWGRYGFSDVLTLFLALDSYVELYKGGIIPLYDFINMKYDKDLLIRIIVKKKPVSIVYSSMRAQRTDFPIIACATALLDGKYRTVAGARPGHAVFFENSDEIFANGITKDSAEAFAKAASEAIPTGSNTRGSSEYRSHLIEVLSFRNLMKLGGLL